MKIVTPTLLCEWSRPSKKVGPCDWTLFDCTPMKRTALISGTCRTYKEARGLLTRIEKLALRMYRAGHAAGRHHNRMKIRCRVLPAPDGMKLCGVEDGK